MNEWMNEIQTQNSNSDTNTLIVQYLVHIGNFHHTVFSKDSFHMHKSTYRYIIHLNSHWFLSPLAELTIDDWSRIWNLRTHINSSRLQMMNTFHIPNSHWMWRAREFSISRIHDDLQFIIHLSSIPIKVKCGILKYMYGF